MWVEGGKENTSATPLNKGDGRYSEARASTSQNMADSEYEQLTQHFPPSFYNKTVVDPYTLVHGILKDLEESSPEEPEIKEEEKGPPPKSPSRKPSNESRQPCLKRSPWSLPTRIGMDCDDLPASLVIEKKQEEAPSQHGADRRRRKLPEIPVNKKTVRQLSLAEELGAALSSAGLGTPDFRIGGITRPLPLIKSLRGEDSSPDSERFHSTDIDSGNSTAHSPDLLKSVSPQLGQDPFSPISPSSSAERMTQLELLDPTHRGLHRFIPRHCDELDIEIGDPIYVNKEADDLWCEGYNLRTGQQGVFPSAYVVDVEYSDFDSSQPKVRRERFILGYLGSVETLSNKGNSVVCQAVRKIKSKDYTPHSCILEISDTGIRMVDRKKPLRKELECHDYFYSLKNVSFCAFHPRDQRYLGFITKHPTCDRFACHVYLGAESTRPVAEAVGRAFQRFYQKFVETAFPVEDIYIE